MRLIDADALIKKMQTEMDMQELYLPIHFKEMLIDEAPTIEAIPIRHFLALLEDHRDEVARISMAIITALIATWRDDQNAENIVDNGKN